MASGCRDQTQSRQAHAGRPYIARTSHDVALIARVDPIFQSARRSFAACSRLSSVAGNLPDPNGSAKNVRRRWITGRSNGSVIMVTPQPRRPGDRRGDVVDLEAGVVQAGIAQAVVAAHAGWWSSAQAG